MIIEQGCARSGFDQEAWGGSVGVDEVFSRAGGSKQIARLLGFLVCAFVFVGAVLVIASPACAATTWYEPTPAPGAVIGNRLSGITAFASDDVSAIDPTKSTMTINGFVVTPLLSVNDPLGFTSLYYDPTRAGASPSPLPYGTNNVTVSVTNAAGVTSSDSWSFRVDAPPVVDAVVPAENSVVTYSQAPTITVTVRDPDDTSFLPVNGFVMKVDTTVVTPTWIPATQTYRYKRTFPPNPPWTNNSVHTVEFNVQDAAGNVVSKTWSFTVDTTPDTIKPTLTDPNPIPGSTTNRRPTFSITAADNRPGNLTVRFILDTLQVYSQSVPQGVTSWTPAGNLELGTRTVTAQAIDAAGNSQSFTWSFTVADTLTASHTTTTEFTTCSACHSPVLTTEHTNRGFTCDTCHVNPPPNVQAAIDTKNTACDACHDLAASHQALHDGGFAGAPYDCSGCHNGNISVQHGNNCDTCHKSTDPAIIAAIAAKNVSCFACHAGHNAGSAAVKGDGYVAWPTAVSVASGQALEAAGPHSNYTISTVKCAVCHSTHGAPTDSLLLTKVTNAQALGGGAGYVCAYCHGIGASAGAMIVSINQATATPSDNLNTPHTDICYESCHAGVHGTNVSGYSMLAAKLLTAKADTLIARAIGADASVTGLTAADFTAPAAGFGVSGSPFGTAASTYPQTAMATGYLCAQPGCHTQSAFAVKARGNDMKVQTRGKSGQAGYGVDLRLTGHPVVKTADAAFNYPAGTTVGGAIGATGAQVAFTGVAGCPSCHDLADSTTTLGRAFPHNRFNAASQPDELRLWLTKASDSGLTDQTYVADTNVMDSTTNTVMGLADSYVTVQDGICLKCHRSSNGLSGVGQTF